MRELIVDLVHHTGSMIRFTTSQLVDLPKSDKLVNVILPGGNKICSKFHLHRANPYIAGPKLVKWIKTIIPFGRKRRVSIRIISENNYAISMKHPLAKAINVSLTKENKDNLRRLIKKLLQASVKPISVRRKIYKKIFENRINSTLVKKIFGMECQIKDCEFCKSTKEDLMKFISEVHHLEHLSKGGSNSPYNLAVLCANHHAIFHRDKTAKIIKYDDDNALVIYLNGKISKWIERNLSLLFKN